MSNKELVLFFTTVDSSFTKNDEKILSTKFALIKLSQNRHKGIKMFFYLLKQLYFLIINIKKTKYIYVWFADYHSVLPALFGSLFNKKCFIVIGGYDAANIKELNYGAHLSKIRSWCVIASCKLAFKIFPVSYFTLNDLNKNTGEDFGYKSIIINNGVDLDKFKDLKNQKQKLLITICGAHDIKTALRKGLDYFCDFAKFYPEYKFEAYGVSNEVIDFIRKKELTKNVKLHNYLPHEHLISKLQNAKYICQFSRYEAFGLALIEGVACGAIPIGNDCCGTKEIISLLKGGALVNTFDNNIIDLELLESVNHENILQFSYSERERVLLNEIK